MRLHIFIIFIGFLEINKILCQSEYGGNIFPIPITIGNEDPNFQECSNKNSLYAHTINCSLFHMCNFGIHTVYSCIDKFYFNPNSHRCQYLLIEEEIKCEIIIQKMMDPLIEFVRGFDSEHHRKSEISKCTEPGIYADILDCSVFHYCHENNHHEILKCPNGFNFDPKTFLCSSSNLVNCQYEPSITIEADTKSICRDYASGTYLPVPNRFDAYIICGDNGESISKECKSGFIYNALTTACENGPCTFDSTLCQNEGQCLDDPMIEKGFRCICLNQYEGEFCEKVINLEETTEQLIIYKNSNNLLYENASDQTTHIPYIEKVHHHNQLEFKKMKAEKSQFDPVVYQQQEFEEIIKTILITLVTVIGLILFGSIIFGMITLCRLLLHPSAIVTGQWNMLREESSV